MDQVHTPPEGRKTQGQHQIKFPQTWIKFTQKLRSGQHKDSISTSLHRHGSSSHTSCGQEKARMASAEVSTDMEQVNTPPEGRKTPGQYQDKFPTKMDPVHTHPEGRKTQVQH